MLSNPISKVNNRLKVASVNTENSLGK